HFSARKHALLWAAKPLRRFRPREERKAHPKRRLNEKFRNRGRRKLHSAPNALPVLPRKGFALFQFARAAKPRRDGADGCPLHHRPREDTSHLSRAEGER